MGNNLISYFTWTRAETDVDPVANDKATPISIVEEVPEVESPTDRQCVAWEIDVSNWKTHGSKGSKTKKRRDGRSTYLREKDNNVSMGGAIEVTSEETKAKLVKVVLPKLKAEVKMAQYCNDIKEKKVLDLKRWYVNRVASVVTIVTCDLKVLYEPTPISKVLWHYISSVLLELLILHFREWTVCLHAMLHDIMLYNLVILR